jgi:hypothetical protein
VAKLLSARRSLFIFIPIWVPRDLSVRDASNTNKKKGSSEFEAGGWIDIEGKAKEAKRKREISLVASTQKLWYRRGALGNGTKTQNGKLSGLALVVVSFPP